MRALATAALVTLLPGAASASEVDDLLRGMGLAPSAEQVAITAARAPGGEVAITLTPKGGARLVADPGITITPIDAAGSAVAPAAERSSPDHEYFTTPPTLHLSPGPAVDLKVEYAYCVVEKQCLFGEATVPVPPGA